jgi:uncharacterized RDD family membrane protein YckC
MTSHPAAPVSIEPGAVFGDYRVARLLGRGGMGAVYEATHVADGRIVAIKLLSVDLDQFDARERFLREGQTAAAINHPNAVYIYGTEEIAGVPVIVMELVPGGTLEEKVRRDGPLPVDEAVRHILAIIDGLDAAHTVGVLHRDVKPSNCFLAADGSAKIGDFGLSKPVDSIEQHKLTQTGMFLGTPVYSAPEQLLGEALDARADIYAVGVTFYYLLTGRLPYESGSLMQVMAAVLNGAPAPLTSPDRVIPTAVQQVVLKAIARHAKDRYGSYAEFRSAVAALQEAEFTAAPLRRRAAAHVLLDEFPLIALEKGAAALLVSAGFVMTGAVEGAIGLLAALLCFAIPEGLFGRSFGKWLLGLRVVNERGGTIGIGRAAVRAAVVELPDLLGTMLGGPSGSKSEGLFFFVPLLLLGALMLPARRRNGWRLVHDWLTGSRVVTAVVRPRVRRADSTVGSAPVYDSDGARLGPYAVTGAVPQHPGVQLGWDAALQRRVWIAGPIATRNDMTADTIPAARRTVSRLTRVRWSSVITGHAERFEVFEAPSGEPLSSRLSRPVSWPTMRNWLLDLAQEAKASAEDGSWPRMMSEAQLWVTAGDEILVADVAIPASRDDGQGPSPAEFLATFADRLLSRPSAEPLPRHAAALLEALRAGPSLEEMTRLIQSVLGRPTTVTRQRRVGPTTAVLLFAAGFALVFLDIAVTERKRDPQGALANDLLDFLNDRRACSLEFRQGDRVTRCAPRSATPNSRVNRKAYGLGQSIGRVAAALGLKDDTETTLRDKAEPKDAGTMARERRHVLAYLAGPLAARVRDTTVREPDALGDERRARALVLIDSVGAPSADEVARARTLVDTLWRQTTVASLEEPKVALFGGMVISFVITVIFSLVSALVFRRGPLLRGASLTFVTPDGRDAPRWRLVVRTLWCWSIVPLVITTALLLQPGNSTLVNMGILASGLAGVALWLSGLASTIRHPTAGWAERLSGVRVTVE